MQAVQQGYQLRGHFLIPHRSGGAQPASRSAGIIDGMAFLSGAFRIDPQTNTFSMLFRFRSKLFQLSGGIKDDMIRISKQLVKFLLTISAAENMDFFPRHLFLPQPRLIKPACFCARKIVRKQGIKIVVGKGLLCQQDLRPCPLHHRSENLPVAAQLFLVNDIAGGGKLSKKLLRAASQQGGKYGSFFFSHSP